MKLPSCETSKRSSVIVSDRQQPRQKRPRWPELLTITDDLFGPAQHRQHGNHPFPLHIVAAELKLHSCGTEIRNHPPERITQAFGRLGPAYRAAHLVAHHRIKPRMKFCYRSGEALAGQFGQRHIEGGRPQARGRAPRSYWSGRPLSPSPAARPGLPRTRSPTPRRPRAAPQSPGRSSLLKGQIRKSSSASSASSASARAMVITSRNTVAVHDETAGL
jgi:hypothetical protein